MNKLIYLYDFDFKRNIKIYLAVIIAICSGLFISMVNSLKDYNYVIEDILKNKSIENTVGLITFENIIPDSAIVIFIVGLAICILYSFIIWNRDFYGKNKSIYTLLMLPENRMKIYLGKLLNIISFTYMYIISFTATLFVGYKLLAGKMVGDVVSYGFVQDTIYKFGMMIPYNFTDFIVGYVLFLIATVSFVFNVILRTKSMKNSSGLSKFLFSMTLIFLWLIIVYTTFLFSQNVMLGTMIYSSLMIVLSLFSSRKILKDKIEF